MAANMSSLLFWISFLLNSLLLCAQTGTDNPTTTTAQQTTTTPAKPTDPPTTIPPNTDPAYCTCDLTANGCDVNCCCDVDCTQTDRSTFTSCSEFTTQVDNSACVRDFIMFSNNTPYNTRITDSGLFCVQVDNFASRNYYTPGDRIDNQTQFEIYHAMYAGSSYQSQQRAGYNLSAEYYKSGDPIFVVYYPASGVGPIDQMTLVGTLGLSAPLVSDTCVDTNPAAFLFNQNFECQRTVTNLTEACSSATSPLTAPTYYQYFQIVSSPSALKVFDNITQDNYTTTAAPVLTHQATPPVTSAPDSSSTAPSPDAGLPFNTTYLVNITPRLPFDCIDLGGNQKECNFTDVPSAEWMTTYCDYTVSKVIYFIEYDGTNGITDASVMFTFRQIQESDLPFTQTFETRFFELGKEPNTTFQRSGNPGYVIGRPLLAGYAMQQEQSDGSVYWSIELSKNHDNWLTMVTSAANGNCVDSTDTREPVTFGTSMRSGCFLEVFYDNITQACELLQNGTWNALRGNHRADPLYVAMFGNSDHEKVGDWAEVLGYHDTMPTASRTTSGPRGCKGLVVGMNIEVVYANVGNLANPQPQVIGVSMNYTSTNYLFQCVGSYCMPGSETMMQRIPVTSSVSFIDSSQAAVNVYAQRPTGSARLPQDFFYPFT